MSDTDHSLDANPQEASAGLSEGLRTCRMVLESYRRMLAGNWVSAEVFAIGKKAKRSGVTKDASEPGRVRAQARLDQ